MSDYSRGKSAVLAWAQHWFDFNESVVKRTTSEADLVDYGVAIRIMTCSGILAELKAVRIATP